MTERIAAVLAMVNRVRYMLGEAVTQDRIRPAVESAKVVWPLAGSWWNLVRGDG